MRTPSCLGLYGLVGLMMLTPVSSLGQSTPAPNGWTVPRTPNGDPDISGVWANNSAIPFERPDTWAEKEQLTPEELAELKVAVANAGQDALFGDQLVLAAIEQRQATSYDPTTGNYNGFWIVERTFSDRPLPER